MIKNSTEKRIYSIINNFFHFIVFFFLLFLFNCKGKKTEEDKKTSHVVIGTDTIAILSNTSKLDGKQLSLIYCQSCHSYPDPSLLPKTIWKEGVLPEMAFRMGVSTKSSKTYSFREMEVLYKESIIPERPVLSEKDWAKIEQFYLDNAPDSLENKPLSISQKGLKNFSEIIPAFKLDKPVNVTMLMFDSASSSFYVGDSEDRVNILNQNGEFIDTMNTYGTAVDLNISGKNVFALNIGSLNPSDLALGNVKVVLYEKGVGSIGRTVIKDLRRPVSFSFADLNNDKKEDIVLSNFGFHVGSLSWYENTTNDQYVEHRLRSKPGAQKTIIKDLNGDGFPDIVALMSQGDEGIFAYYNDGKGEFREERLLNFSPLNGSNYIDLVDFNNDGLLDILYANGDNADYSFSLKPYHGLSIFVNEGKNRFKQKWEFPLQGASKAVARDFDRDGDLDIAAIAFFPDYIHKNPVSFVYLENSGGYNFTPSTLKDPSIGRWLTMETGDFDKDGDEDIALGKYLTSPTPVPDEYYKKWGKSSPYILILKNQSVKK
jgi:hypothetical protein